jgi:hypothetical protein
MALRLYAKQNDWCISLVSIGSLACMCIWGRVCVCVLVCLCVCVCDIIYALRPCQKVQHTR